MVKLNENEMRSVEGGSTGYRYCSLYSSKKCSKVYQRGKWKSGYVKFSYVGGNAGYLLMYNYYSSDYYNCLNTDTKYN